MAKETEYVHSTSQGKLYVNVSDLLQRERVKDQIKRLMDSSIYKQLKVQGGGSSK